MSADPTSTGRRGLLCAGAGAALALAGCAAGQPASAPRRADTALPPLDGAPAFAMPGTRQIDWAANGHVHRIFVAEPIAPPPAQGYPVIFVLDGNILFPIVAQLVRNRGARSDMAARFPAVVVGLGYATPGVLDTTARAYDYTPPLQGDDAGNADAPLVDPLGRREGGADAFLDLLDGRIRPWIAGSFPLDPRRQTLFGHSYGGLLALHALFTRPALFTRYCAASPSVWWRGGPLTRERDRFIAQARAGALPPAGIDLLMTAGGREGTPPVLPTDPARAAIVRQRQAGGTPQEWARHLEGVPGLRTRFVRFEDEDHGSTMAPAAGRAVALALQGAGT
ncbi:alpha/beta hydrolase-fold protein [Acidovorax sp. NCPPB 3859]|nr:MULTISPECIES: alpha/beta hydrolase-fold protein [unclassified Acidovorax]MDA8449890.1 alpha/beta hydrolase-fold protein [Acidovorax sp. GBBC 3297]MDA8459335.1 alpha/beta hydrolase-fold protein [Acidovorax sp. GBBC 3333]MDA8464372.1 alpha/beta hydrolase-fold protein [Acidovorax sp. GBBC 3332]MDA8469417.1 alpha/beta hydrolase-fold protein [Acidovorax sp. GBBC 3299]WCM79051.1 alpha/beta hydrolase-fold protein [Acidovorax sp. GBBC 712]